MHLTRGRFGKNPNGRCNDGSLVQIQRSVVLSSRAGEAAVMIGGEKMFRLIFSLSMISFLMIQTLFAQVPKKDKGKFVEKKNEFLDKIQYENKKHAENEKEKFILDFTGMDLPKSKDEFKTYWHNDPISQGNSGICWCFCTTSFYENGLINKTYQPGGYFSFHIFDPKPRYISAAPFPDRVVHHALCNIIEPIFNKTFIYDCYANRKDKGIHAGIRRVQKFLRANRYVFKFDI